MRKKILITIAVILCFAGICFAIYVYTDRFVEIPTYNGFDEETLANMILIEKSYNGYEGFVIYGDGRIYSYDGSNMTTYRPYNSFAASSQYIHEYILGHGTFERKISRRDLARIIQYISYIEPDNYEMQHGRTTSFPDSLFSSIYDYANQRRISLINEDGGGNKSTNISPYAKDLIKLLNKYSKKKYFKSWY